MADKFAQERHGAISRGLVLQYAPETLTIVTDKSDPLYDPRVEHPVPEWFVRSVMEHGVSVPILVTRDGTHPDGHPCVKVVDGRQRVRACCEANVRLRQAGRPVLTIAGTPHVGTEEVQADLTIVLNEHRVTDLPSTRAAKMVQMQNRGVPVETIAERFRVTPATASAYLKLGAASAAVRSAVDHGELPIVAASKLAKLSRSQQTDALAKLREGGSLRSRSARETLDKVLTETTPKRPPAPARVVVGTAEGVTALRAEYARTRETYEALDCVSYTGGYYAGLTAAVAALLAALAPRQEGSPALAEVLIGKLRAALNDAVEKEDGSR